MLRVTFVMEQHLGHRTYYENLRRFVDQDPGICPTWVEVTYGQDDGILEKLSFLPSHLRGTLRGRQQVRAGLKDAAADLLFFNTQVPAALAGGLARASGKYVIATDLTPIQYDDLSLLYCHKPDKPGLLKAFKKHVNVSLLRRAARLLPWSTWARSSLVEDYGVDPDRIEVLPPGVDLQLWHPNESREDGPVRILFVGGDFERKGGPHLMDAFRALPSGSAELHLVTRSLLPDAPGVRTYNNMQPNSPGLIALYQHCDIFALPSGAEAFGIAAVEACAAGLPVIATREGGLVDIVADGATGYLTASNDDAALSARLRVLVEDASLRQRMARAARQRAEARFDAQRNAARLLSCLQEVEASEAAV